MSARSVSARDRARARWALGQVPPLVVATGARRWQFSALFAIRVLETLARPLPARLEAHLAPWGAFEARERARVLAELRALPVPRRPRRRAGVRRSRKTDPKQP